MLAYLTSAYSITGKEIYRDTYWTLVNDHGYVNNAMNVKIDSVVDENHSDTELIFLAYHTLFYALQRLAEDDPIRQEITAMVDPLIPSLRRTWKLCSNEYSPLWTGIYVGTAGQSDSPSVLSKAVWTLRLLPSLNIKEVV